MLQPASAAQTADERVIAGEKQAIESSKRLLDEVNRTLGHKS